MVLKDQFLKKFSKLVISDGHRASPTNHNTPLLLGNSSPSILIACLNVLPNTLNKLSILWWSLSPMAFKCSVASSENARDWKKCSVSSVLKSPTLSRLNLALNLIQGLPDKSKAHSARHSSIGSTKPKRAMPRLSPRACFNAWPRARAVSSTL